MFSSTLPFALGETPVAADETQHALLLGHKFHITHDSLGPIVVKMVKSAAAFTAPKNMIVIWSDDALWTVSLATNTTEFPCGVIVPDISGDVASGDLLWVIVSGRCNLRNEDATTIEDGNLVIPSATDGLVNDGGTAVTARVDFARMIEAFTANGQTKRAEILGELVG